MYGLDAKSVPLGVLERLILFARAWVKQASVVQLEEQQFCTLHVMGSIPVWSFWGVTHMVVVAVQHISFPYCSPVDCAVAE